MPNSSNRKKISGGSEQKYQKLNKIGALKRCPLFKRLSNWELLSISRLARLTEFRKDEIVFHAGDNAASFYIVISGRFEAYVETNGEKQVLAYMKQGGFFGEMALISDQHHSATVNALSDSLTLAISKADFKRIISSNAKISLEISRVLSARLRGVNIKKEDHHPSLLKSDIISVYSSHRKTGQTAFSMNLAALLYHETKQRTILLDMSPSGHVISDLLAMPQKTDVSAFKDLEQNIEEGIAAHLVTHSSGIEILNLGTQSAGGRAAELTIHLLNRLAVDFRFIVVDLPNEMDETVVKVMTQADTTFFVTDNNMPNVSEIQQVIKDLERTIESTDEKTKIVINESLLGFSPTTAVKRELFGDRDCFFLASPHIRDSPDREELVVLSHPDLGYSKVIRHIARKLSKNLIGIALGSGAALGYAHIGVLKVLEREKIPIDFIAGSSMGALIASFYAVFEDAHKLESLALKFNLFQVIRAIDFSIVPLRGMIIGKQLTKLFRHYLKDARIEDTKIPLVIVGSNISARKEILLNTGLIRDALRASIAIPGIFHPVVMGGETVIDGGIIDPLPIRPLLTSGVNKIIAVDVLPSAEDIMEKRRFHTELRRRMDNRVRRRSILIRALYTINRRFGEFFQPNWIDVVVSSMQNMEHEIALSLAEEADVVIRPSMPLIKWMEFHKARDIIRHGEEATENAVDEIRSLVKQQTI